MEGSRESARDVSRRLAYWYRAHKRVLPWRRTNDPYAIWLSEVMLQQTTVEVIAPRWERFLSRFPSVEALARAPEREILAEWSGLGYYARARNLHRAAKDVALAGAFPRTLEGLKALPGVGSYTAAAVGSICFGIPEPAVDGNVVRVFCRLHGLRLEAKAPATLARVRALARPLVPARNPGGHNQAVMELGALVCTPRAPRCGACPLRTLCRAAASGKPEGFPRRPRPATPKTIHLVAGIVERGKKILLVEDKTLVKGHVCVPLFPVRGGQRSANVLRRGWERVVRRSAISLEAVATLRHSVLERRYLISLFTFKEESPVPPLRRPLAALGSEQKIILLSPLQITRHAHGGLMLKVLAAWRAHRAVVRRRPKESGRGEQPR
ncbi:MAG: A/G-specific adenine glycosylase [Acidobacteriota bacterium]|nr:A/G-specific adenine glycosylase [Acidobacteriota bacterium]